jgi:hypothetical protein
LAPVPQRPRVALVSEHHVEFGAFDLADLTWKPAGPEFMFAGDRTLHPARPAPALNTLGTYSVDAATGMIRLEGWDRNSSPWNPFTPRTDGQPTYREARTIADVQLAAETVAIESYETRRHDKSWTVDFFRGPNGDFIRQIPKLVAAGRPQVQLSPDGRLVAVSVLHQVEVQTVDDPRRLLLTPTDARRQALKSLFLGENGFAISTGRKGCTWHLVNWSGPLTVHTETRKTAMFISGFNNREFERFIAARPTAAKSAVAVDASDPARAFGFGTAGKMDLHLDRTGQVTIRDGEGKLVLVFYSRGESWSAWMPDGTRLGRGGAHLWRSSPNAAAKMGAALRAAKGGGA